MDRAQARAGEHRHHRLGHHRHVDDDAVSLGDAQATQGAGEAGHLVPQLAVADRAHFPGQGAVPDQGRLLPAALFDVQVDGVEASVELAAAEPAIEGRVRPVEHLVPALRPADLLRRFAPEALRLVERAPVFLLVAGHGNPPAIHGIIGARRDQTTSWVHLEVLAR